jgi:hypothetical protein
MSAVVVRGTRGGAVPREWLPVNVLLPLACLGCGEQEGADAWLTHGTGVRTMSGVVYEH